MITVEKTLPELNTKNIRLEVQGTGKVDAGLVAVTGANQFIISTPVDISKADLFVYGAEVNDFRTVDYEAISMLNVSATQQLSKQLKDAQERLKQLETENSKLKSDNSEQKEIVKTMKAQIDSINERLNLSGNK